MKSVKQSLINKHMKQVFSLGEEGKLAHYAKQALTYLLFIALVVGNGAAVWAISELRILNAKDEVKIQQLEERLQDLRAEEVRLEKENGELSSKVLAPNQYR